MRGSLKAIHVEKEAMFKDLNTKIKNLLALNPSKSLNGERYN